MNVLLMLDGAVQGQGLKLSSRDWLDLGSETWSTTSDKDKAAAYQAVVVAGWKDDSKRISRNNGDVGSFWRSFS